MKQQATKTASTCFAILKWLRKILRMLPLSTQKTVIQALIVSRLDYGNMLYLGASKEVLRKLQVVQSAAARLLCKLPRMAPTSSSLRELHWLKIHNRAKFKALCFMHKINKGSAPHYISALVHHYLPPSILRSSNQGKCQVPRIKRARMGGRSFTYLTPSLWNSLPLHIRFENNYLKFRKKLKSWLFDQ